MKQNIESALIRTVLCVLWLIEMAFQRDARWIYSVKERCQDLKGILMPKIFKKRDFI